jgi:hypothetical protein
MLLLFLLSPPLFPRLRVAVVVEVVRHVVVVLSLGVKHELERN